jgi:di/tricarboxylate transporter
MAILLGGAIAWLLEPIPDFAVALAVGAAWGIGGFAPPSVVLSGFASSSWLLAVAAIGISAAMASSGLLFRAALALLRVFPATERGQVAGLLVGGAVITPFVPSVIGRVATVAPIARDLAEALGRPRSPAIAFAAVVGATVFGPIFLTGVITNFLVLSLLPAADQTRFDWIGWLLAAAPAGVILLLGSAIVLLLRAPASPAHVSAAVRRSQERSLGRMSRRELVALIALGVFAFGLLLQPFLRADAAWIGLVAMLVAIGGGALDRQTFRSGIDWSTVTFFGVLIGSAAVLRAVGVDRWIAGSLEPIARSLGDPVWTIALLAAVTIAVRLLLPMIPAGFLLLITLVPAASELGLDGWVVGFVVATLAFTWLLPRQYEVIRMTRGLTGGQMFTERDAVWFGIATTAVALIALALSIPFWRAMGLL